MFGLWGLSMGNHLSIFFLLPLLIWASPIKWRRQEGLTGGAAFVGGLAVYGLLPWHAAGQPPINWGGATTWPNFWWLVSATPYRPFVFALSAEFIPVRIAATLNLLAETFLWAGLPLGLFGWWQLVRQARPLAYSSLASAGLIIIYAIGYNTTDSDLYLLPAVVIFAVWVGWGMYHLVRTWQQKYIRLFVLLPLIVLLLNGSNQDLSNDYQAYYYALNSLTTVAPDAVIITKTDAHAFALQYGRYGLGIRPDVAVVQSHLLPYAWYRHTVQHHHPGLHLVTGTGHPITDPLAFIEQNVSLVPIYLAEPQSPQPVRYPSVQN
jgi:hypothetical protein